MGLICPECGGKAIVVNTRTNRKRMETIRYHTCQECGHKFKTIERLPSHWNYEARYEKLIDALKKLVEKYS